VREIALLAVASGGLRFFLGVAARLYYPGDSAPEGNLELARGGRSVFENIMKEAGDRKLFVSTTFEHERGDTEEVRHIGDLGSFAHLIPVRPNGEVEGVGESLSNQESLLFFGSLET
jgi:hypothetical protein